jgi:membrane protein implicated in regulation of membrane protease activity
MLLATTIVLAFFVLPSPWGLVAVCVAGVIEVGEIFAWKRFLSRYRVSTGAEGLIGMRAEVIEACDPSGRARVRGELWNAVCSVPLASGQSALVAGVDGLVLSLEPDPEAGEGTLAAAG